MASSLRAWNRRNCSLCCVSNKIACFSSNRPLKVEAKNGENGGSGKSTASKKYSQTVFLPKTTFSQRISPFKRLERDSYINEKCSFSDLYSWQRKNVSGPEFILHDGPPYANGKLHMGHAINKILKDVTIRQKVLRGNKVHYVPGWDCHGLPIELKAVSGKESLTAVEIRGKARKFAKDAVNVQRKAFKSWGIMADWENGCYYTFEPDYIKSQLRLFWTMYEKGYIYRDLKPVYWSPSSRTALAEAELEYDDEYVSTTATVKMKLSSIPNRLLSTLENLGNVKSLLNSGGMYALIWTTTPWTLPSNQAICFSPKLEYVFAKVSGSSDGKLYLLGKDVCQEIGSRIGKQFEVLATFSGELLNGATYSSSFSRLKDGGVDLPFLPGGHVTGEKGTGLVHTAPAHGPDDFVVGLSHGLSLDCHVNEDGCFSSDLGYLNLDGLSVLSNEATERVISILDDDLIHSSPFKHSYPCDWRTKLPVILRASMQWFVDTNKLKDAALENLSKVVVLPERGAEQRSSTMASMLQRRPYWCISRQRAWGVPLPALYHKTSGKPLISKELVEHVCTCIDQHGPDSWWTLPLSDLASGDILSKYQVDSLEKGQDIMDIWFDSGVSWSSVLGKQGNTKVADLYLEGLDQFTGWFQSSLMTSCAVRGTAPYKKIYVHGFAVDGDGRKMSKSLGNVVDPEEITHGGKDLKKNPAYGIDALRWWVASHSGHHSNVPVSSEILKSSAESVHKIRIVLRFLLGALSGLKEVDVTHCCESEGTLLDKYLLHLLHKFNGQISEHYESYQFNRVCTTLTNFITNEVSALYCHLIKDRLYCSSLTSSGRISCLRTLSEILDVVSRAAAPILPHLIEEVYLHHPLLKADGGFFRRSASTSQSKSISWHNPDVAEIVELALNVRKEAYRKASVLGEGNSWKLGARIGASGSVLERLRKLQSDDESSESQLAEILQVSLVHLGRMDMRGVRMGLENVSGSVETGHPNPINDHSVTVDIYRLDESAFRCERCRRYTAVKGDPCHRCHLVLQSTNC